MKKIIRETLKKEKLIDYVVKNIKPPYIRNLTNMGFDLTEIEKILSKIYGFKVWVEDNSELSVTSSGSYIKDADEWELWSDEYEDTQSTIIYTESIDNSDITWEFYVIPNKNLNESTISDVKDDFYERLLNNLLTQTKFRLKNKYSDVYIEFPFSETPYLVNFIEELKQDRKLSWEFFEFIKKKYPNLYDEGKIASIWKRYMNEIEDIWVKEHESGKDKKLMDYIVNFLITNTEIDFKTGLIIQDFWETIGIRPQFKNINEYLFGSEINFPDALFDLFEEFGLMNTTKGYYVWDMYRKKLKEIVLSHGY